jgi:hypothetical protein
MMRTNGNSSTSKNDVGPFLCDAKQMTRRRNRRAENAERQAKRRTEQNGGIITCPDKAPGKTAPNGARATFRGIRSYWITPTKQMSIPAFTPKITEHLRNSIAKYGGDETVCKAIGQHIGRLERGEVATELYDIDAYATLIGVQPSLLTFFAQMVSKEHAAHAHAKHGDYNNTIIARIHGFRAALDRMEDIISTSSRDVLSKTVPLAPGEQLADGEFELYVNIDTLRTIVDAYKREFTKSSASGEDNNGE